ncbi:hypothetical protein RI054_16g76380 [Pseudoscourfieldia marina]
MVSFAGEGGSSQQLQAQAPPGTRVISLVGRSPTRSRAGVACVPVQASLQDGTPLTRLYTASFGSRGDAQARRQEAGRGRRRAGDRREHADNAKRRRAPARRSQASRALVDWRGAIVPRGYFEATCRCAPKYGTTACTP